MTERSSSEILSRLRDERIIKNAIVRHMVKQCARNYFCAQGFIEVDTPILGDPLDEYTASHFTVQGRGSLYSLPQSPQLYKQLIVMRSLERYFQFPHCFRDEEFDPRRTDQAPEFMQIDFELRTDDAAEVRSITESFMATLCAELNVLCQTPFPVIDAVECVAAYGTDKPDLKGSSDGNVFLWVVNFPLVEASVDGKFTPAHHPFALPVLPEGTVLPAPLDGIRTHSYDLVLNGMEIGGGDLRIHSKELQEEIIRLFGLDSKQFTLLLEAMSDGSVYPHGGMGIGFDRLVMQLTRTKNIRDVNFF
jgi:aspartyl-tRNA synthetase